LTEKKTKDLETENKGALKGVRIVDLTAVVFGAYATQILGDMGADVIKIEAPSPTGGGGAGGDIMRWPGHPPEGARAGLGPIFMTINRNKRSVVLDLASKQGRDALLKIIAGADVLTSNIRYAAMKKLGLAYEDVKAVKPDIIFVHAAGYGSDGPYAGPPMTISSRRAQARPTFWGAWMATRSRAISRPSWPTRPRACSWCRR